MARDLNLKQMANLSGDQMQSQFIVRFTDPAFFQKIPGMPADFNLQDLSLRMDQPFDPPARARGTYQVSFQGLTMMRFAPTDTTSKEIQLQVRLDENWVMYQAFDAWYNYAFDDIQGIARPDRDVRTVMEVDAYGLGENPSYTSRYINVRMTNLKEGGFDHAGTEPMRMECSFVFDYVERIYGGVQRS